MNELSDKKITVASGVQASPAEINFRGILIVAGLILIILILALTTIQLTFHHFKKAADAKEQKRLAHSFVTAVSITRPNFPLPREQVAPREDLKALAARETSELNSYGWVDRAAGVVRVPIARAMQLLLEQGLPTRTNQAESASGPSTLELQQQRPEQPNPPEK